jgi:hypothetical protein
MWNSLIANIAKCEIETTDNRVKVKGHLSVEAGGLIHVQNLISAFGGVLSVVAWESSFDKTPMAFMRYTIDNYIIGFSFSLVLNITPEMAQKQIAAWGGNDLMKFKKCNLTLVDNCYFVRPNSDLYEAEKKSVVN